MELLHAADVAELLGIPVATLANWRASGKGPPVPAGRSARPVSGRRRRGLDRPSGPRSGGRHISPVPWRALSLDGQLRRLRPSVRLLLSNGVRMASIDKRPNGRWRARYRERPGGPQRARHFDRKADAERSSPASRPSCSTAPTSTPTPARPRSLSTPPRGRRASSTGRRRSCRSTPTFATTCCCSSVTARREHSAERAPGLGSWPRRGPRASDGRGRVPDLRRHPQHRRRRPPPGS